MQPYRLQSTFLDLTTPHLADACMRLGVPVRCAPAGVRPLWEGSHIAGRVCPARHFGSVDVFIEAISRCLPGDVLVVDNAGRTDEACVGDLIALEAATHALSGIVIWGLHRDTSELRRIRLPVFSLGAVPTGPARLEPQDADALSWAAVGEYRLTPDDVVIADDDGMLFIPIDRADEIAQVARALRDMEREQAARVQRGDALWSQTNFSEYISKRQADPSYTFRQHLRAVQAAIEE